MKMHTKLFIAGAILLFLPFGLTQIIALPCLATGFILLIVQGATKTTNKNKDPHNDNGNTPPWEK